MKLRLWQRECIQQAINAYQTQRHFLCLATPGAGKTVMAVALAKRLLSDGHVDFVLCFSPSTAVAHGFRESFEQIVGMPFDGGLGARGDSLTYQHMATLSQRTWDLLKHHKVFVIFDEIHHCGGDELLGANIWGSLILQHVKYDAAFTLSLSGTPWRTDNIPVVLANYEMGSIDCDYVYGLQQAIQDEVCRIPTMVAIDNSRIEFEHQGGTDQFHSLACLLESGHCGYQSVLNNRQIIQQILKRAIRQLDALRRANSSAGGLVVASSVVHAQMILEMLCQEFNQDAVLVSHKDEAALQKIHDFKMGTSPWIVSVGMISEGTDIPRLQVCCHLSFVKTELYFRQILGRVVRRTQSANEIAYLYFPAQPALVEYAHRVAEDIPEFEHAFISKVEAADTPIAVMAPASDPSVPIGSLIKTFGEDCVDDISLDLKALEGLSQSNTEYVLNELSQLRVYGRYKQTVIELHSCL